MTDNDDIEPRDDIGLSLGPAVWLVVIAGALALIFALGFGIRHFFETRGPATMHEKYLDLEDE